MQLYVTKKSLEILINFEVLADLFYSFDVTIG